ncbi:MAG: hypothetical protein WBM44_22610, partial [Waterburya sp.]
IARTLVAIDYSCFGALFMSQLKSVWRNCDQSSHFSCPFFFDLFANANREFFFILSKVQVREQDT